ncbi:Protein of unknown function [Gryllus bimaculatus]|nr:Protein of unknown function [Gryllus bimaculatus]
MRRALNCTCLTDECSRSPQRQRCLGALPRHCARPPHRRLGQSRLRRRRARAAMPSPPVASGFAAVAAAAAIVSFAAADEICLNGRFGKTHNCSLDHFCCGDYCCPRSLLIIVEVTGGFVLLILLIIACLCHYSGSATERRQFLAVGTSSRPPVAGLASRHHHYHAHAHAHHPTG